MLVLELSAGVEVDSQFYFTLHNQKHKLDVDLEGLPGWEIYGNNFHSGMINDW